MNYLSLLVKMLLKVIAEIENIICIIGLWLISILIFFSVINRYFLHLGIMWIDDFALYCFIFFALFACAVTTRENGHTAVDIFRQKYLANKPKADMIYSILLRVISIVFLTIFLPTTWKFMLRAMKYPQYGTLVRWVNTSWLQSTVFVSMVLILLHLFVLLVKDVEKLKRGSIADR